MPSRPVVLLPLFLLTLLSVVAACSGDTTSPLPCGADECEARSYEEMHGELPNPERGYYAAADILSEEDLKWIARDGASLVNARVRLDDFRGGALSDQFLADLDAGFDKVRSARLKAVVRFQYNDGSGEDADLDQVLAHIAQLAPILADRADLIATVQAGFIGAWGEWHDSSSGLDNDEARRAIAGALLAALPADRTIQVRTPGYKDALFGGGPLDAGSAFSGTDLARVGHHDDCLLADQSDEGTYDDPVDQWRAYVAADGRFVPVGGEPCTDTSRLGCDQTLSELEKMHWSFLNGEYPEDVIGRWKGGSCYDEIGERLGYRFVLSRASWTAAPTAGGALSVALEIVNRGFTAPFTPRPALLVLDGPSGRIEVPVAGGGQAGDPRRWQPGDPILLQTEIPLDDVEAGSYRLSLWLPDGSQRLRAVPAYAIRLANPDLWDDSTGENVLEPALQIAP